VQELIVVLLLKIHFVANENPFFWLYKYVSDGFFWLPAEVFYGIGCCVTRLYACPVAQQCGVLFSWLQ
jgi:hypothetical protein